MTVTTAPTATAEDVRPGDTITTQQGRQLTVQLKQLCPCVNNHYPGNIRHFKLNPKNGPGIIASAHAEFPVVRAGHQGVQPLTCQPAYAVGYVFTGDDWGSLPPQTLLVDAWGGAYRIGWEFMNPDARTVVRYNTAGQGRPDVYALDDAPEITADAQLRIVFLGS